MTHAHACYALMISLSFVTSADAQPASSSTPPLLPGEIYLQTKNGCAMIYPNAPTESAVIERTKADFREMLWTGPCPNGLANGFGAFGKPADLETTRDYKQEYIYGRMSGKSTMPTFLGQGMTTIYQLGGQSVFVENKPDPFAPAWSADFAGGKTLFDPDNKQSVRTLQSTCFIDEKIFRGCSVNNDFPVFGIVAADPNGTEITTWCPNPRSSAGCEVLWEQKAGDIIARTKEIMAAVEKKIAEDRKTYAALTEPWIEAEPARKLAEGAAARRAEAAAVSTRDAEKAEHLRRESAAAEKANKAFVASLGKLNAGELFALADSKRNEGDRDKEREALKLLITKFPNHALVAVAAQQMSRIPASGPAPAAPPVGAAAGATPARRSVARDDAMEDMAGALGANKKGIK